MASTKKERILPDYLRRKKSYDRLERHPASGLSLKETSLPKRGGRGRYSWGSFEDEVKMAKEEDFWRGYQSEEELEDTTFFEDLSKATASTEPIVTN
jgi:hypothetical protein